MQKTMIQLLLLMIMHKKATDNGEVITTEVTKKVVGENNQQLDVKEIDTEELILQIKFRVIFYKYYR